MCGRKKKEKNLLLRLLQNIGVKDLVERTSFTHLVDQNRIGNTINRSDLTEINDRRADQEPEISIRDIIKSGVLF